MKQCGHSESTLKLLLPPAGLEPALNLSRLCMWRTRRGKNDGASEKPSEPSLITNIRHSPKMPRNDEAVTISAQAKAGISSVSLEYQILEPGVYVALKDRDFEKGWVTLAMKKVGSSETNAFTAQLPGSLQKHRQMIRYRFRVSDAKERFTPLLPPTVQNQTLLISFTMASRPGAARSIQKAAKPIVGQPSNSAQTSWSRCRLISYWKGSGNRKGHLVRAF